MDLTVILVVSSPYVFYLKSFRLRLPAETLHGLVRNLVHLDTLHNQINLRTCLNTYILKHYKTTTWRCSTSLLGHLKCFVKRLKRNSHSASRLWVKYFMSDAQLVQSRDILLKAFRDLRLWLTRNRLCTSRDVNLLEGHSLMCLPGMRYPWLWNDLIRRQR